MTTTNNSELRPQLKAHLSAQCLSQASCAKALGVSGAALSTWLAATYQGDNAALEQKIKRYLRRESNRAGILQIPVVFTGNYKYINSALAVAQEEYDIAVIVGAAGTGKTTALKAYAQRNSAIYIKAHRGLTMHRLFSHIAELLGLPHGPGKRSLGLAGICAAITETLEPRDTLLIIDEAEYLSDNSLELLRQVIHDDSRCGLALCGLPKLAGLLRNMVNDHEQLLSRVGVYAQLEPVPQSDFGLLMDKAWPDLPQPLREGIYRASLNQTRTGAQPSLRNAAKIMARMYRACARTGAQPSAELVEEATRLIMTKK